MRSRLGARYSGGEWDYFVLHGFDFLDLFVVGFRVHEEKPNAALQAPLIAAARNERRL